MCKIVNIKKVQCCYNIYVGDIFVRNDKCRKNCSNNSEISVTKKFFYNYVSIKKIIIRCKLEEINLYFKECYKCRFI